MQQKTLKRRAAPAAEKKTTGWAIGTTAAHYFLISALAEAKGASKLQMLEEIVDYYIESVLAKAAAKQ